ncbi:MAG: AbrB/MazE/SpoVT family DNA-binding domain-containing protein [Candidatus Xenobia bacterium]
MSEKVAHARVTSKGQVTIPKAVRDRLALETGDDVEFLETRNGMLIRRSSGGPSPFEKYRGHLRHLRGQDVDVVIEDMRGR